MTNTITIDGKTLTLEQVEQVMKVLAQREREARNSIVAVKYGSSVCIRFPKKLFRRLPEEDDYIYLWPDNIVSSYSNGATSGDTLLMNTQELFALLARQE